MFFELFVWFSKFSAAEKQEIIVKNNIKSDSQQCAGKKDNKIGPKIAEKSKCICGNKDCTYKQDFLDDSDSESGYKKFLSQRKKKQWKNDKPCFSDSSDED